MGIKAVIGIGAFSLWLFGQAAVIYWSLRQGNRTPPQSSTVTLVWLISLGLLIGSYVIFYPSPQFGSQEASRLYFVLLVLPWLVVALPVFSSIAALLSAAVKRRDTLIWLPLLTAVWAGLFWLYALISFRAEYGHWPLEVQQHITEIQY